MKKHLNIPIFIPHIGCPNDCVFCNQKTISGHENFKIESVRQELAEAFSTVNGEIPVQIAFFGGSFTGIPKSDMLSLLEISDGYIEKRRCDSVRLSTRPDYIDEEILEILKKHHVKTIELGVQSMDDSVLAASGRGHTARDTEKACSLIKKYGFSLVGQMMIGLPEATAETETATAEKIIEMGCDAARIYPTVVFKRTKLEKMMADGTYPVLSLDEAVKRTAAILAVFIENDIPVIRVGLQATEMLASDEVLSPYHPAIGELCYSLCMRNRIDTWLAEKQTEGQTLVLTVNPSDVSETVGQHAENRHYLLTKYKLSAVRLVQDQTVLRHRFAAELHSKRHCM